MNNSYRANLVRDMNKKKPQPASGGKVRYKLDSDTKELTVYGDGYMADYVDCKPPWYGKRSEIGSVIVKHGVCSIGRNAFSGCPNLTDVILPDSIETIGLNAFPRECPWCAVSLPERLKPAFDGCSCYDLRSYPSLEPFDLTTLCAFTVSPTYAVYHGESYQCSPVLNRSECSLYSRNALVIGPSKRDASGKYYITSVEIAKMEGFFQYRLYARYKGIQYLLEDIHADSVELSTIGVVTETERRDGFQYEYDPADSFVKRVPMSEIDELLCTRKQIGAGSDKGTAS